MAPLVQTVNSSLGLPPNSYIYKILSTSPRHDPLTYSNTDQLAVISSDDSLRFLDPATLQTLPGGILKDVNKGVTCLERVDDEGNLVGTAGRDGLINFWDKRSRTKAMAVTSPSKLISSLVCDGGRNFLAAGIENPDDGPGVSPVYIWDQRNVSSPQLELVESHTDTVTTLQLHPNLPTLLLSGSTDGLINVFDTSKADEEDALYQVINHRSAVAQAGFMYPGTDIYALGTDETLSFYGLQSQKEDEEEPAPKVFGDVREHLGCEYLAKLHWVGDEPFIAAGKHSENHLDLVPISKKVDGGPLAYEFEMDKSIRLPGGHGEEIIRDVFTDVHSHTTYTCGEDGHIRAWKLPDEDDTMLVDDGPEEPKSTTKKLKDRKEKRKERKEKRKGDGDEEGRKARFKPY